MASRAGRYSYLLRPLLLGVDLSVLLAATFLISLPPDIRPVLSVYIIASWFITAVGNAFYQVYRFTTLLKLIYLLLRQFILFTVVIFAFYGLIKEISIQLFEIFEYILTCLITISFIKIGIFNLLKKYRIFFGQNKRRVIILGKNAKTQRLKGFFEKNPAYGYELIQTIDLKRKEISLTEIKEFVLNNKIDELYCSIAELKNDQLAELVNFAENNLKTLKFIPDSKNIFTKKIEYQYYGITPIISLRSLPAEKPVNQFLKRFLDFIMALLVIVCILSWLVPIIALFIIAESKGPVFFKQKRNGLDGKEFYCFKFRSMYVNERAHSKLVSKNDIRITTVGRFLRKTSIDELPQFVNVLLGDMSVVGPRPHMVSITHLYAAKVDKFMVRHLVKPGITGLAQVSGYRGEMETENDIKNRVRFDIFYIENWSVLMDLRIIAKTMVKSLEGDSRAY
ncbi:exopolysaccharide biosynthesis polyprenyl glycosylphosphotransferase [Flavimarina sp. Hel_I_48]|uniref:exopolysaccharide biosynthesis polyprenyl glycosylphosphotransferase n=1 Tax=Flavimarina sp. Hel_I_48 TaxID=1392488 RepID=UPI0004DF1AFA|nr:exopolysaccharide biosynthesis polyprenyl glycosylphosphotransferase [Flavimarina sp. Hel_I_48]